jgi:poly [ADP-ribose] polymerase 2/3/4
MCHIKKPVNEYVSIQKKPSDDALEKQWTHRRSLKTLRTIEAHEIENLENIRYEHQMEILARQDDHQVVAKENENSSVPTPNQFMSSAIAQYTEEIENEIRLQSSKFFKIRDLLEKCEIEYLRMLLLMNECEVFPESEEEMLDICAEFLTFGVLKKCQKCGDGEMKFAKFGYKCIRWINEWVKCGNFEEKPKRRKCTIPDELRSNKILKQIEPKLEDRVLRQQNVNDSNLSSRVPWISKMTKIRNRPETDTYSDFSCVLTLVDIEENQNNFFKMQILGQKNSDVHSKLKNFYLFTCSGRIGSDHTKSAVETFDSAAKAIKAFEKLFLDKTGCKWTLKEQVIKIPGKFYPSEVGFYFGFSRSNDDKQNIFNMPFVEGKCDLDLCDVLNLEKYYGRSDFQQLPYDHAPRVTHSLRENILATLSELEQEANNEEKSKNVSIGLSNKFFTLLPQNFGSEPPPILDDAEKITEMRKSLEYSMKSFEHHCCASNTNIKVLDRDTDEYQMIATYVENTSVHQYSLNILDVFEVKRSEEETRYEPYKNFPNRTLLWHGSPVSNFKSILENGLRIPPEANGRMFGRGIYFADMVSKSANYCRTPSEDNVKLIALCEVALGKISQNYQSIPNMRLADDFNSLKACGRIYPNPAQSFTTDDGVLLPLGKPVNVGEDSWWVSSLDYNEYVVYNENQIKLKYLVKFRVNKARNIFA